MHARTHLPRYEWMVDQLPVWGFVGEARKEANADSEMAYIYTHKVRSCNVLLSPRIKFLNCSHVIFANLLLATPCTGL